MRANPDPNQVAAVFDSQCPVMQTDPHGPIIVYLLKPEGGMPGISLKSRVAAVGQILDFDR